jgi:hypothetical protein
VETNSIIRKISGYGHPKGIHYLTLSVFISLLLLIPSSVSIFYLPGTEIVYAQQEGTSTPAASSSNVPAASTLASTRATPVLPQTLQVTDIAMGDTSLPLRASIVNNEPVGELSGAGQDKGQLGEYFPIVVFHFDKKPVVLEKDSTIVKHVLMGPIKSYDSIDSVLGEANYWKDIPLDKKVALETDHPGLHYFIASVQFANGTSGIYSGMMEVNVVGIKPSTNDGSVQFQLGPADTASGVLQVSQSDLESTGSDPVFQRLASEIICSDLSNNGFEVCEDGEEEQVLEEGNEEDASRENDNENEDEEGDGDEEVETRGDGGRDGRYNRANCTGEQCEDADRETEEEEEGDYCDIDPGYCPDKNDGNNNDDDDDDDDNGSNDDNNDDGDNGNDEEESGNEEENSNENEDGNNKA